MVKLFSIKEKYSKRIYSKEKLVEFRKQNVNINNGEFCFIYTSSPVKKVTGYFVVKEKLRLPLDRLWDKTKDIAGITKSEFISYFSGCLEGTAILFKAVKQFTNAINLREVQILIKGFRPPQSYYNINKNMYAVFVGRLGNKIPRLDYLV